MGKALEMCLAQRKRITIHVMRRLGRENSRVPQKKTRGVEGKQGNTHINTRSMVPQGFERMGHAVDSCHYD